MYRRIDARPSVREQYTTSLVKRGDLTPEEGKRRSTTRSRLQTALDETRGDREATAAQPPIEPVGVLPHLRVDRPGDRRPGVRGALVATRRVHDAPEARPAVQSATRCSPRGDRLGARRGDGLRVAAVRGHPRFG
ncbi:MAG: hypothetical protein R2695_01310 [Acidimicrobiales bacterium]